MVEIERAKRESGVAADVVSRLEAMAREEFPDDPAMAELHLLRMLMAINKGWVRPEAALNEAVKSPRTSG
jgi:hypothetical protein